MHTQEKKWDWEIKADKNNWDWNLQTLFAYRHLIGSFVRRDLLLNFQQTILGPVWLLVQPILTLIIYVFVFGKLIGLMQGSTLPPVLFYFSGIILWNFFNESFSATTRVFRDNIHLFSKVYFPRIVVPIATLSTHFVRFSIQLLFLICIIIYYVIFKNFSFNPGITILFALLAILCLAVLSFSMGLIFSVITAKYRDIGNLVEVCVRLLFFVTPILYPLTFVREDLRWVVNLNPLTPLFELFRASLFNTPIASYSQIGYSLLFTFIGFVLAIILFQKQGNKLIDVI